MSKYMITPPPDEKDLYRVVYVIDVMAGSVLQAARAAHRIMSDPDSLAPVLDVIDNKGNASKVDLSKK